MAGSSRGETATTIRKRPPNYIPQSLPLLLSRRVEGQYQHSPRSFVIGASRYFCQVKGLVQNPQLLTPQTQNITKSIAINALNVDRVENRFVLAGGADALVSVYDLSKWGSEEYLQRGARTNTTQSTTSSKKKRSLHKPIATSQRAPPRSIFTSPESVQIPSGHASPIANVQWYPIDTGAFVSASKDGSLLVWDTDSMTPVAHSSPFDSKGIGSLHLKHYSAVVASLQDPALKLVDIRSSAASHTLLGHGPPGVSGVQWAPHTDVLLASGGLDGTVRLWDIRKAGGRACVAMLNQDMTHPPKRCKAYQPDYSHLPKPSLLGTNSPSLFMEEHPNGKHGNRNRHSRPTADLAPNNYHRTENTTIASHSCPVTAVSFGPAGDGHYLTSAGQDGSIHVWDLRDGHLLPLRFLAPSLASAPLQRRQTPMLLTPFGAAANWDHLGACWVGHGSTLLGYSLERGGLPQRVLQGHLNGINAIDAIEGTMQILTAGRDGMILTWGKAQGEQQRKRKVDQDSW